MHKRGEQLNRVTLPLPKTQQSDVTNCEGIWNASIADIVKGDSKSTYYGGREGERDFIPVQEVLAP